MTKQEVIEQLIDLKIHCLDFKDKEEKDGAWSKDIQALNYAISFLTDSKEK